MAEDFIRRRVPSTRSPQEIIESLQRFTEEIQLNRQRSTLFELSLAITAKLDRIDEILNLVLDAAIDRQNLAETGSLFLYEETMNRLILHRKSGVHESFVQYSYFDLGDGIAGHAGATRRTVRVNDCNSDDRYKTYTKEGAEQLKSIIATPITAPGSAKLLGVLCAHNSKDESGFTSMHQTFLEGLSRIAGVALNNAQTYSRVITDSQYDSHTGLLNSQTIERVVNEFVGKASVSGRPLSILYIDIDGLKRLNDNYSTDVGDRAIIAASSSIKGAIYPEWRDRAGKWKYGDEFVVVLTGANNERALEVAESIRAKVAEQRIEGITGDLPHVTVSIGIAELKDPNISGHDLVLRAEEAKGRAKAKDKNQISF